MVVVWPHSGVIQPRPSGTGAAAGWWWYGHTLELSHPGHQVQEQLHGSGMATLWSYPT